MRRVLVVAAVAVPALVLAVVSAPAGTVVERTNAVLTGEVVSYVNAAMCAATNPTPARLEWDVVPPGGFTGGGNYQIFASDTPPATNTTTGLTLCAEKTTTTPAVTAGRVDSTSATAQVQDLDVSGSLIVTSAGKTCDTTNDGATVYVCVHWRDTGGGDPKGSATGKFLIQLKAPGAPTGVIATSADRGLQVSWAQPDQTDVLVDHYIAYASLTGTTTVVSSATATKGATGVRIGGLTNGTTYDVVVIAYSVGGNPSPASPSPPATGTPMPGANFWDVYQNDGGTEKGGCASGAAGALALLGTASLLALRRRKP